MRRNVGLGWIAFVAVGAWLSAAGCDGDGGAADVTQDVGGGGTDVAGEAAAPGDAAGGETAGEGDAAAMTPEELAGVYSFAAGTFELGTATDRWQSAPAVGQPDREIKGVGGLVVREDGTFVRVITVLERANATAEPVVRNPEEEWSNEGTWTLDGHQVTTTDEDDQVRTADCSHDDAGELMTFDILDAEPGEAEQVVWRRRSLDPELPGAYALASIERDDGVVIPVAGVAVGAVTLRCEGELDGAADGTFTRRIAVYADDVLQREDSGSGVWYTDGVVLGVTLPGEDMLRWTYVYDDTAGTLTQETTDAGATVVRIVWERTAD